MSVIWVNKPKKLYIIETDQKTFKCEADYLNYKKCIQDLRQKGYTNIHINYIGYAINNNY